jgi:hypothetical protein
VALAETEAHVSEGFDPVPFHLADQTYDPDIPLKLLHEHPDNPNLGDVEAIAESLDQHGFYGAVIVQRSTGAIVAGNHRFRSALRKGAATLPGFWLDIDDDEAARILAVDNRTTHLATFDEAKLVALLTSAAETPRGLAGTGYDDKALNVLRRHQAALAVDDTTPGDEWQGMPGADNPGLLPAYSIVMHFPTDQDAERFFALLGVEKPGTRFLWWPHRDGHKGVRFDEMIIADPDDGAT